MHGKFQNFYFIHERFQNLYLMHGKFQNLYFIHERFHNLHFIHERLQNLYFIHERFQNFYFIHERFQYLYFIYIYTGSVAWQPKQSCVIDSTATSRAFPLGIWHLISLREYFGYEPQLDGIPFLTSYGDLTNIRLLGTDAI